MEINSILKGLDEAVKISSGKMNARRQKVSIMPAESFSNQDIKNVRMSLKLTQASFAEIVGVNIKTVEAWEKGTNSPNGSARRLISILKSEPEILNKLHIIR